MTTRLDDALNSARNGLSVPVDRRGRSGSPLERMLVPGADEWFRAIYTRAGLGAPEVIGVCSAVAGEGKTTVALGLAVALALDYPGRRLVLVETDLQRPILAADFELAPGSGLVDCLQGERSLDNACRRTALDNLDLIPAGTTQTTSSQLLRSMALLRGLAALANQYSHVILDIPPLLTTSDAIPLTRLSDSLVLVIRAGVTPTRDVEKARRLLEPSRLRGVVLNDSRSAIPSRLRRLFGA